MLGAEQRSAMRRMTITPSVVQTLLTCAASYQLSRNKTSTKRIPVLDNSPAPQ